MTSTPPSFADLLPSWLLSLKASNKSPKTIAVYHEGVRLFLAWCEKTGTSPELTRPVVQGFVASLFDAGRSANTARARQVAVKRFSAWCAAEGETGADQLAGLAVGDVDVTRGVATVHRAKGGNARLVPFGATTATTIDRYIRIRRSHPQTAEPQLWLGERGQPFSYLVLYRALQRRAALAGIDRFHPHLLRHTAATRWLAAGGSEGGLMAVAGWRSREMLDRYTAATASSRAADEARRLRLGDL